MKDEAGKDVIRCYVKGAPDQLLARASKSIRHDGIGRAGHGASGKDQYLARERAPGPQGLRVMATAERDFDPATFDPTTPTCCRSSAT